ncbi:hypothetical protein Tcan_03058 [Toxocara canis]|uniref:Serpentine receptor class alpha/beta-14 n=1 Tax=Toxocara canis TaxID=6265 RepID=A0A0B2VK84_TOXCA|nr:hypothetical protein Tcan_03058 [Toxocara canis]
MFVVVAIERGVACVRSSTYEGQGIQLAVCLQITVLLIALVLVAINVRNETIDYFAWETASGTMETTLTCAQIFLSPKALLVCALSITVLNITSLAGYIAVYRINMGRFERVVDKGGAHSLSERFQINEIIKAMRLLFPSIAVIQLENIITICIIIYVSSQIHYKKANDKDIVRLWNMEQVWNIMS